VDDDERVSIEFKALDVIRWVKIAVDVSEIETGYEIIDLLGDDFEKVMQQNQDLPLIARIEIYGNPKAHDELAGDPERWTNEIRSAAIDISGGRIWIEKVIIRTTASPHIQTPGSTTGPVPELLGYIDEIRSDPEHLRALGKALDELRKKLPREFKESIEGVNLDDPVWMRHMLDQVRPMLLQRLLKKGDSV